MISRSHSMHQGHALLQNFKTEDYLCGGCKTEGNGMNFGCVPCNFHMHDFCSNCPMILSSFLHTEHYLSLMISNTQYMACPRICDVCQDTVEGLFYWCQTCNFIVHPLCTMFPPFLSHVVHYSHYLMFQKSYKDAPCCVCGAVCNSWRYRCGYCDGFDVHVECVVINSYDTKPHDTNTRRLPPCAGLYTYGGVSSPANSYNMYKPPCANDQTTPPYMYNPYGGVSSDTYGMYNQYGLVPHGSYNAHQPNNFQGEMPVGSNSHCMCHSGSGSASGTNPNGIPLNINSYNSHNGAPFDSNPQHVQIQHGDTSHQAPAHNGQGYGKLRKKIFRIVTSLAVGVASNVIWGAILL